jgi:5,10-methylenetetrahydromethanopterin reductase
VDELVRGNASIWAHFQRDVTSSLSSPDATVVEEVTSRYDNYHHGLEHAAQAEVIPADFLSRFCVIGSPEACTERLCRLVELGLSRLVIVGGSRDIDATVRERSDHLVAREILPALQAVALPGKPAELGIDL